MSLTFNGGQVKKVNFNGDEVKKINCDGVEAWTGISPILNENSWEVISEVARAGKGADYWNIGDCKEITLNGKIGDYYTATNLTLCVFILDFNHKDNNIADNNIIFGGFKTALSGGVDVALRGNNNSGTFTDGSKHFNMNHWGNYNYGGWKGADLRYDILGATSTPPSEYGQAHTASCVGYDATDATIATPVADTFLAALPFDLRNVLRLWDRWVDAKGNSSNVDKYIQKTTDAVSLLTEFEIYGYRHFANQYEKNHQAQVEYYRYANGNPKIKYKDVELATAIDWWNCSTASNSESNFSQVEYNGKCDNTRRAMACNSLAPAFKV
jgi:hypothetical protein